MENRDEWEPNTPAQQEPPLPAKPPQAKNPVERLYDKIPLSFKQADILVKVLAGLLVALILVGLLFFRQ